MPTEIKIIQSARELKEFFYSSPYQFCAFVKELWDDKINVNPYCIGNFENEYLFAVEKDDLYRALLLWDERNYHMHWHAASEDDYKDYGLELAPGWWEITADIEIPKYFELFHYEDEAPPEGTPIEEVEKLGRACIFNDDYSVGVLILSKNQIDLEYLDESIEYEEDDNIYEGYIDDYISGWGDGRDTFLRTSVIDKIINPDFSNEAYPDYLCKNRKTLTEVSVYKSQLNKIKKVLKTGLPCKAHRHKLIELDGVAVPDKI